MAGCFAVHDLIGVMRGGGLLAPARPEIITDAECREWLARSGEALGALERDPAPLLEWLEARLHSPLLGRYFEALVGFWIERLMRARRLEQSIVVSQGKRTLGELDFVFEDARGALSHWEVAVKFYLCRAERPEDGLRTDAFWGAMTQDRLSRKIAVLLDRQLGMPRSPEGKEALAKAGFAAEEPVSRLFVKGMLFYPAASDWRRHPHPPEVSPGHQRGWWSERLPPGPHWAVLERKRWLSPFISPLGADPAFEPIAREPLLTRIAGHFKASRAPVMLARLERGEGGAWRECDRGLVVKAGWPELGPPPGSA